MADFYKILKADPLGEPWTPNKPGAKPIQNWWCQVEGQELSVNIGKQVGNDLRPGMHVYGDLVYAKSQRTGNPYWKFTSIQVPEDVQRPADTPAQATAQQATGQAPAATGTATGMVGDSIPNWFLPIYNMIEYIYNEMKKMDDDAQPVDSHTGTTEGSQTQLPDVPAPAKKPEQLSGEPLDAETQKTLDDIFTQPETPDDIPAEKK